MNFGVFTLTTLIGCSFMASGALANTRIGDQPHAQGYNHPEHVSIGRPAAGGTITRTIEINIKETKSGYMLFDPDAIHIKEGSVVRFVINNFGDLDHEFFLGSFDEIAKHKQWMQKQPDMKHDDPNAVFIASGTSETLDWNFSNKANLEYVCLIPGHREAGMFGVIMVNDHLAREQGN